MSRLARLRHEALRRIVPASRAHARIAIRGECQSLGRRAATRVGRWLARLAVWILLAELRATVPTLVVLVAHEWLLPLILWVAATVLS